MHDQSTCACGCGGSPSPGKRFVKGHNRRIAIRWEPDPVTGCWNWIGAVLPKGYGFLQIGGRTVTAHRWTWARLRGPIPDGADEIRALKGTMTVRGIGALYGVHNAVVSRIHSGKIWR